jgi:hypothetical protein
MAALEIVPSAREKSPAGEGENSRFTIRLVALSASRSVTPNWAPEDTRYPRIFYPGSIDPAGATPIEMAPGTEIDGIGLTVSKLDTVSVRGQVLNSLPATITLCPESVLAADNSYMATESIAPGGRLEFDGVVPGTYNLRVTTHEGGAGGSGASGKGAQGGWVRLCDGYDGRSG